MNNRYEIFAVNFPKGEGIEKAEGSFRVMTYNVNATMGDEDPEVVKNGIVDVVERNQPDILCLQELSSKIFKEIQVSLDSLFGYTDSMAIKKEPQRYWIYSKKPIRNFKRYKCITEIDTTGFTRSQQGEVKHIKKEMPVHSAEIEVEADRWITVFACHLRSSAYSTARRSMEEGTNWSDGISLYLNNYKIGKKIRDYEADNFRMYLDSLDAKDIPVIIAGDFNDWSGSYCMNTIRNGQYKDAWWERGFGFGITYSAWHLKLRLDHILYSNHFKHKTVSVDKIDFSDHYPLIADFKLK